MSIKPTRIIIPTIDARIDVYFHPLTTCRLVPTTYDQYRVDGETTFHCAFSLIIEQRLEIKRTSSTFPRFFPFFFFFFFVSLFFPRQTTIFNVIVLFRFLQNYYKVEANLIKRDGLVLVREMAAEVKNMMDFKMNAVMVSKSQRNT